MKTLAWNNELSIGNEILDAEHRNLIAMANEVAQALKSRECQALMQAFEMLERWLRVHFDNEEKIAQAVGLDFSSHKQAQQYSLKELRHMRDELLAKEGCLSGMAIEHFIGALKYWMVDEHIVKLDMRMKPALQAHGYRFWPGREDIETKPADKTESAPMIAVPGMDGQDGCLSAA